MLLVVINSYYFNLRSSLTTVSLFIDPKVAPPPPPLPLAPSAGPILKTEADVTISRLLLPLPFSRGGAFLDFDDGTGLIVGVASGALGGASGLGLRAGILGTYTFYAN